MEIFDNPEPIYSPISQNILAPDLIIQMTIKNASTHGVYHHRAPSQDQRRPNILLSSDIPNKIAKCVSDLKSYSDASSSGLEDLSKFIKFFDLTLELNSVILRNVNITISKLLNRNQIFVARSKKTRDSALISEGSFKFPEVWQSVIAMRNREEIFVVNSRLDIEVFTVNLRPPYEICLSFKDNEDFSSLLAYDKDLLDNLKAYISQRLLAELKYDADPFMDDLNCPEPQQQSPTADLVGMFNDLLLDTHKHISELANRSLDDIDMTCAKQLLPMDNDEFSYSFEDLRILHSDDSGKCTVDDESEANSPLMNTECFLTTDIVGDYAFNSQLDHEVAPRSSDEHTLLLDDDLHHLQSLVQMERKGKQEAKEEKFVSEIGNLRHNFPKVDSDSSLSQNLRTDVPFDINAAPECDGYVDDIQLSPKKTEVKSIYSSPQKALSRENSVQKQGSFSFIDHDDGHGLNYAFKGKSVPEYIKENKKLKFIKIGKVQKFVSMFEEKTEPTSNTSSRIGTRPSSPKRELH